MADIIGIDNMSEEELRSEIARGGRFVQYIWCISILVMTFKNPSDIYFIRAGESATKKGLSYTFLTLFLGWWGVPWGPIYSLQCLGKNLSGGYDLTDAFLAQMGGGNEALPDYEDVQPEPQFAASEQPAPKAAVMPAGNRNGPVVRR